MFKRIIIILLSVVICCSCGADKEKQQAQFRLQTAREMYAADRFNSAKLQIDSIHLLYPRQVELRRQAVLLADSIDLREAERTMVYSDSLLQLLQPQADQLLRTFRHEKDARYEDHGGYIHQLLVTTRNINRCMLQAVVGDDVSLTVKSYYFGKKQLQHSTLTLTSEELQTQATAIPHCFRIDDYYEILSLSEQQSCSILQLVSAKKDKRIKVTLSGKSDYTYYLQENEKDALEQTYRLFVLMRDIKRLEENLNKASKIIELKSKKLTNK